MHSVMETESLMQVRSLKWQCFSGKVDKKEKNIATKQLKSLTGIALP